MDHRFSMLTTRLLGCFLCCTILLLCSCASLKSGKDDDMSGGGVTVSLDDLDYVESPAPPLPDEKETPEESAQTVKSPQTEEIRADLSAAMRLTRTRSLRKRIFVLPFANGSDYTDRPYGEIVTRKLVERLETSGQVLVLDDHLLHRFASDNGIDENDLEDPVWIKRLYQAFSVHAVVSGALVQLNVATTQSSVSEEIEVGLAVARIRARLVDAATGNVIRTYTGRNPLYKSKEIGEFNRERAVLRAIDVGMEDISTGLLESLRFFDWWGRVIRIDGGRVYIDAGQQSGLVTNDVLDVYGPGQEIVNPATGISLGWAPGALKGRVQVSGFFGIDGAYASPIEGDTFSPRDMVKISETLARP